mgnify:CR=1 FL=1
MSGNEAIKVENVTQENVYSKIEELIKTNSMLIFMKGTPSLPMCGFSARVIEILKLVGAKFGAVNVLEDMLVREGIKKYSNWPTIPQIYHNGDFIGGCDILMDMYESGELNDLLTKE